jgi:hypothetical protein
VQRPPFNTRFSKQLTRKIKSRRGVGQSPSAGRRVRQIPRINRHFPSGAGAPRT